MRALETGARRPGCVPSGGKVREMGVTPRSLAEGEGSGHSEGERER